MDGNVETRNKILKKFGDMLVALSTEIIFKKFEKTVRKPGVLSAAAKNLVYRGIYSK